MLLLAAVVGAYLAISPQLPRSRRVVVDLGDEATDVTDIELSWIRAGTMEDAALTTRWHFAPASAPRRLPFEARLADGPWDVEVSIERQSRETTRWRYRVNLEGAPFWKKGDAEYDRPVVIPVREALR